ncbi:beta-carotene 15,15'-monooxygenase [Parapedobacter lycopersici]|uniref:beta-carotene 15,15'-monooxygenase n=1 Tax=Parapedobacter lycopersici TaxID=1864939 RepID=UPI00214D1F6B|nr:beta-carotene 15,15'-monooxygenase [Parapedobacter lycopersici]
MIQFLKDSTFAVNEVINKSWDLLRQHYFSVAGLCFLLFLTSNTSGILAFYLNEVSPFLSAFMAFLFVILYFGIQLALFKYIFQLIDGKDHVRLQETIPTTRELVYFFAAMCCIAAIALVFYFIISLLGFPLVYAGVDITVLVDITRVIAAVLIFLFLLRVAFYPFFIIDRHAGPWRAVKLSFALTKGNITKLLLILVFFAILHLLYIYFNYSGYPIVSTALSVINSFLVGPLSSVVVAMAYRDMMMHYQGGEDPKVTENII